MHRRRYRNGCKIFAQQKNVFLITLKNIAQYYYNGFEENICIYIYINIYIYIFERLQYLPELATIIFACNSKDLFVNYFCLTKSKLMSLIRGIIKRGITLCLHV